MSLPGSLKRYTDSIVSEAQAEGASFLYRGIPRSFLWLMLAFFIVYAAFWTIAFIGIDYVQEALLHVLGLLLGITLAVSLLRLWPRLENAVPRWFRIEADAPELREHHKYLVWAGALGVILICAVFVLEVTFASVMVMGLVGGMYILFRLERRIVDRLTSIKGRLPWLWSGGGWRPFLVLFALLIVLVAVVSVVGAAIGSNEDPLTHEVKALPTLAIIIPSIALAIQALVLIAFVLLQAWRSWMARRRRRGKAYGRYRGALLNSHPSSLAYYLMTVNYATGAFLFSYTLLLVIQAIGEARSQGLEVGIDIRTSLTGQALDVLMLLSFVIAWIALLLNLSGSAVRDENQILNRRVFASLSVFFIMVLFVHVIAARGDEFTISVAFRAMYLTGIAVSPAIIIWRRWKAIATRDNDVHPSEPRTEQPS